MRYLNHVYELTIPVKTKKGEVYYRYLGFYWDDQDRLVIREDGEWGKTTVWVDNATAKSLLKNIIESDPVKAD